ncbi:diacylglycerol kinase family lipid kinase [Ciceribacter sp. L1K23]|uniref:diacylglycerol/lipid kinase family protein n=1 Tax=Ciceribacter sp. L1K23 TaxID=2820276 RepID=UPI001B840873|nr:diacylglycerol kinase family protein [Ciceribacter sp. L1K23]MBR0556287.1 diacylglycerol kinase family lipid kinase [Ciceribacter sp. L1K23]
MKLRAVLNRDGGTFRTTDMADFCARTTEAFARADKELECRIVAGSEVVGALEEACADSGLDGVIAGGGDGTISAAAGLAWRAGLPLGVIPAGTMNLFARALKMPLDIHQAVEALATSPVRSVDIATANGRPFVHQFSAGMHARMVRMRNQMEFASRLGKMRASSQAILGVILDPPRFEVAFDLDGDGKPENRDVSAISVSNNPFGANALLVQDDPAGGKLGVYFAAPVPSAGVAKLAFDILRGRLKDNEAVDHGTARTVRLHFPKYRKGALCVLDGELLRMPEYVEIRQHPGELRVIAPAAVATLAQAAG